MIGYRLVSYRAPSNFGFPGTHCLSEHFYQINDVSVESSGTRYLCVCKVDDIWQLHRRSHNARPSAPELPYILDLVHSKIGNDLSSGRCFLLLDQSGEGHPFFRESFDDLHAWCQSVGLNRRSVGYVTQNRALLAEYNSAYGSESSGVHILFYDWIINAVAAMFQYPPDDFRSQFGFSKTAPVKLESSDIDHLFLCLNATPRANRISTLALLSSSGILPRTLWSLMTKAAGKIGGSETDVRNFLRRIGREYDLIHHAIALLNGPGNAIDNVNVNNANQLVWSIDYESYRRTAVSLVTETDFSNGQVVRVTEKSVKALGMARPVIIFGNPKSLDQVRSFGFQTFHPFIDESYDNIHDVGARFNALSDEIRRVDALLQSNAKGFLANLGEIAEFNGAHARDGGFLRSYKTNVEAPFYSRLLNEIRRDPNSCR